mmetsp:Transcript_278/g.433  ORF Transcript_278/g.433 Transcript_278/m.433 type:complete len:326 (+) Transcript_278:15-992(+)
MDLTAEMLTNEVIIGIIVAIFTILIISKMMGGKNSDLKKVQKEILNLLQTENCGPILVRLAWHDSGTYNAAKAGGKFSETGGANGSIRFDPEIRHGANAGLTKALGLLQPIKMRNPTVSWADIIQMASAEFIHMSGGPKIPMRYGRVDAKAPRDCPKEGNLPSANEPFGDGSKNAAEHLRRVFNRMGFNDQEIVALSGAHTVGRAFKERSGVTPHGYTEKGATKYTCPGYRPRHDGKLGIGMAGGQSWTENWLTFDNSYFTVAKKGDKDLLRLETDKAIESDPGFAPYFKKYAESKEAFFKDYAAAHKRLSELGSVFDPPAGIVV